MQDVLALVASFAFILVVAAVAFLLYHFAHIKAESARKIIHIGVSNWVFILEGMFSDLRIALAGPIAFIVLNTLFVYSGAGKLLGMGDRKRDNGLIYFPFSLLVLVLCQVNGLVSAHDVVAGTLVMGYGDGLAALAGMRWGRHKYSVLNATKSWEGSIVMLVVSFIVCLLVTPYSIPVVVAMAVVATVFEAVTPLGLDNITVPLLTVLTGVLL